MNSKVYQSEQPIGVRTCRVLNGGSPFPVEWLFHEVTEFGNEILKLAQSEFDERLSPAQQKETMIKLRNLMLEARAGTVAVGSTSEFPSRTLTGARELLELRPFWNETQSIRPPRLLRLYYGEPQLAPHNLLPLHLATKPKGPDTASEQDIAIAEADGRATAWARSKYEERAA